MLYCIVVYCLAYWFYFVTSETFVANVAKVCYLKCTASNQLCCQNILYVSHLVTRCEMNSCNVHAVFQKNHTNVPSSLLAASDIA